jgi:pimeloyl-ACP methyl ester carboxylesterase
MDRGIVLIPGAMLGPYQPLLTYTWLAGRLRGAQAHHVEWPADRPSLADSVDAARWVNEQIAAVLAAFPVARPVLAGKSLGTFAAELAAERGLPGIWHTPILTAPECVAALRRASAPYLLIGGTADELWDGELARDLTPHVVEVPGADHGMILEDQPLARSAEVLGRVVTAIEEFLDQQVWRA